MRFRLCTLLILLSVGPPVLAGLVCLGIWLDRESSRLVPEPDLDLRLKAEAKAAKGFVLDDDGYAHDASGRIIFRVDPSPPPNSN